MKTVTAAVVGMLLLMSSACAAGDASAGPRPAANSTAAPIGTPAQSPSASATPAPQAPPLSPFEDRAPVQAARAFSAAVSRAINARQRNLRSTRRYMTAHGQHVVPGYAAEDYRRYHPGPNPFTPVGVRVRGDRATIRVCWQSGGWARYRGTSCAHVRVKGVAWSRQ